MSGMGMTCESCGTGTSDRWVMKVRLVDGVAVNVWRCDACARTKEWPGKVAE